MGKILGLIGELIPIIAGIYCVLYFGGHKTPKTNNDKDLERFNQFKSNHGTKMKVLGIILIIFGVFGFIRIVL